MGIGAFSLEKSLEDDPMFLGPNYQGPGAPKKEEKNGHGHSHGYKEDGHGHGTSILHLDY